MSKSILQRVTVIAAVIMSAVVFLTPGRALADATTYHHDVATVQYMLSSAYSVCSLDTKVYKEYCTYAEELDSLKSSLSGKSIAAQKDIFDHLPSDTPLTKAKYDKIKFTYVAAQRQHLINADGTIAAGSAPAAGAEKCGGVDVSVKVGCSDNDNPIYAYLSGVIKFIGGLIGLMIVITLIVSGIQYSASAGEPANIAKAKDRIFNAVIGLILYIFLAAILTYIIPGVFS